MKEVKLNILLEAIERAICNEHKFSNITASDSLMVVKSLRKLDYIIRKYKNEKK